MKCPVCDVDLQLAERSGVEIDYCPKCRGVWLDRGELDKIVERANEYQPRMPERAETQRPEPSLREPVREQYPRQEYRERPYHDEDHGRKHHDDDDHDGDRRYSDSEYPRRKKKSFLSELFDFGGD